jgi:RHS repeat-associated protein
MDGTLECTYRYLDRQEYDEFGDIAFREFGNGNQSTYQRYPDTRALHTLTSLSPAQGGRVQQALEYRYDKAGNVTDADNNLPEDSASLFGGPSRQHYDYDAYYRVDHATGVWDTAPQTRRQYTLDLTYDDVTGNLLTKDQSDWTERTTCKRRCTQDVVEKTTYDVGGTYRAGEQHQLATLGADTYTYDLDGNVTTIRNADNLREMSWDSAGRMTMIVDRPNGTGGKPTYYTYDYEGERAIEDKETGRTWTVNPWTTVRDGTMWKEIWAGSERLATKFSETGGYEVKAYWLQKDLQGSTNVVSDRTGSMFQHRELFPSGEIWVNEESTTFRTPYQAFGAYFDEDHAISDFGQRWRDPRSQAFLSVDPAGFEDPTSLIGDPTAPWTYTFAGANPVTYGDPDGRARSLLNPTPAQVAQLVGKLTVDDNQRFELGGAKMSFATEVAVQGFFAKHTGLRGKLAFSVLSNADKAGKRQKFADKWSAKPLVELSFGPSGLENVKLSLGTGKRLKLSTKGAAAAAGSTAPAVNGAAPPPPPPPPPNWRPKKAPANTNQVQSSATTKTPPSSNGGGGS